MQRTRVDNARLVYIALTQSLDPEQPGLCAFYIEVASNVTVDCCSVVVKLSSQQYWQMNLRVAV